MLLAITADFASILDCQVVTTWDSRLGRFPLDEVTVIEVSSPIDEHRLFRELSLDCDATLIIAPEFDGILANRCRIFFSEHYTREQRFLGSSLKAIELCADKLTTARHFLANSIPTIKTLPFDPESIVPTFPYPLVIKPRYGAGSLNTDLIRNPDELDRARTYLRSPNALLPVIQQPFVRGEAVSVAVIISAQRKKVEVFPVSMQQLSDDGRFQYQGGSIPAGLDLRTNRSIEQSVRFACRSIPGLSGYVGFDFVIPEKASGPPILIEINPRLTTSYLGYRLLTDENLAERLLSTELSLPSIQWKNSSLAFYPDGRIAIHG